MWAGQRKQRPRGRRRVARVQAAGGHTVGGVWGELRVEALWVTVLRALRGHTALAMYRGSV